MEIDFKKRFKKNIVLLNIVIFIVGIPLTIFLTKNSQDFLSSGYLPIFCPAVVSLIVTFLYGVFFAFMKSDISLAFTGLVLGISFAILGFVGGLFILPLFLF